MNINPKEQLLTSSTRSPLPQLSLQLLLLIVHSAVCKQKFLVCFPLHYLALFWLCFRAGDVTEGMAALVARPRQQCHSSRVGDETVWQLLPCLLVGVAIETQCNREWSEILALLL